MRTTLRFGVTIAVLALSTLFGAAAAQAAPPANDNFADAQALTSGVAVSSTNVDATIESGETHNAYGLFHSAWYEYTPASNGVLALTSCSAFPSNLIGYSGVLGSLSNASNSPPSYQQGLTPVSCAGGYLATVDAFPVSAGVPVKISIGSAFSGNTGAFELTATFTAVPPNDDFANAVTLTDGTPASGQNNYATLEPSEEEAMYSAQRSVWYTFTPTAKGVVSIDVCSTFAAHVITWTGASVSNLTVQSYSPQSYGASVAGACASGTRNLTSMVDFPVVANEPLRIQVMGQSAAAMGSFDITADYKPLPANDDFADAVTLTADSTVSGNSQYATIESNEEEVVYTARRSVWYTYTPTVKGVFSLNVCSAFPSNTVAWTGSAVDSLTMLGYSPPSYGGSVPSMCESGTRELTSIVDVPVQANVPLRIQVMGKGPNDMGAFDITASFKPLPVNDDFADAITLVSGVAQDGTNEYSTVEVDEESVVYSNYRSVWYQFTPAFTGELELETCSEFGANVVAWTGSSVSALTTLSFSPASYVASAEDTCDSGTAEHAYMSPQPVTSGVPIRIQVMGKGVNEAGDFSIRAELHATPANDSFASATDLGSSASVTQTDDNFATLANEASEPNILAAARPGSVWYKWISPINGTANFSTCSATTAMNGSIGVYSAAVASPTLSQLTAVTSGGATDGCTGNAPAMAQVSPAVELGKAYWIAVANDGAANIHGRFTLTIATAPDNLVAPVLSGDEFVGDELTLSDGDWAGSGPLTYEYAWFRCDANQTNCGLISGETDSTYTLTASDDGSTIRGRVTGINALTPTAAFSDFTGVIDDDTDGDAYGDDVDACDDNANEAPKTNGCPVETVQVVTAATLSPGASQIGAAMTLAAGTADNDPGLDPSVGAPTSTIYWYSCSSPTIEGSCQTRTGTNTNYTPTAADLGRFIRAEVAWINDDDSEISSWTVASAAITSPPVVTPPVDNTPPPAAPAPVNPLTVPTAPKSLGTVKAGKKGAIKLTKLNVVCAASATGPCTGTATLSVKLGKKVVKFGVTKQSIAPGTSASIQLKISSSNLKKLKKAKKGKATLAVSIGAPGFPTSALKTGFTLKP